MRIVPARCVSQGQGDDRRRRCRPAAARGGRPARWRSGRAALGRSLSIREVDAGSCNGCELEIHALNNPVYDIERFGLEVRRLRRAMPTCCW
jgi:hypothetical protein